MTKIRRTLAHAAVFLSVLLGSLALTTGPALAAGTYNYRVGTPMSPHTAYGVGLQHTNFNSIFYCVPTGFAAQIHLTTSGGSRIRTKVGNCSLSYGHATEYSTNAWCQNNTSSTAGAYCQVQYD